VFHDTTATVTTLGQYAGANLVSGRMPAPVRVLAIGNVYPPHHLGGYEIIWRGVMAHLRAGGHATRVLTTDYRRGGVDPREGEDPDVYRELDWYWRDHAWRSLGPRARLRLERHNARVLERHLSEFAPDVITWWPLGGLSLGLLEQARRRGVPGVLFVLDYWPIYGPRRDLWLRLWSRLGPVARAADRLTDLPARIDFADLGRWIFCSRTVLETIVAAHPEIGAGAVIPPGVERHFLAAAREPELPPWRWRLLYVGRVVEQKGVLTAIESLRWLPDAARLRVVGDGAPAYRARLEAAAEQLGVADRVSFEPACPRRSLIDLYRWSDAVVFPVSWDEPWGLVPLEAMALGRPVVATGRGGSGDYLVDRGNALLFEAGDAAGLARALEELAADPKLRERLRARGYDTAARHREDVFNHSAEAEILAAARARLA
jgi:glycogen(starch) synthase